MDTLFLRKALASKCIWQIFLFKVYFYFKGTLAAIHLSGTTIILGNHLQWSSIFKGTLFLLNKHIPIFKGIELIRKFSCSHPFNELFFFYYERAIAATHSFKFTVFTEQELYQEDIVNTNYDTSLVSGMHILKEVCYMTTYTQSSKPGHGNLILITSTVQVELSKLNFNFIDITNIFYIVFQVLKVLLIKYCKIQSLDPSFLVVFISFYISRYHFSQVFRTSFNIIWKKDFRHKFSFFNRFTQTPTTPPP